MKVQILIMLIILWMSSVLASEEVVNVPSLTKEKDVQNWINDCKEAAVGFFNRKIYTKYGKKQKELLEKWVDKVTKISSDFLDTNPKIRIEILQNFKQEVQNILEKVALMTEAMSKEKIDIDGLQTHIDTFLEQLCYFITKKHRSKTEFFLKKQKVLFFLDTFTHSGKLYSPNVINLENWKTDYEAEKLKDFYIDLYEAYECVNLKEKESIPNCENCKKHRKSVSSHIFLNQDEVLEAIQYTRKQIERVCGTFEDEENINKAENIEPKRKTEPNGNSTDQGNPKKKHKN